MPESLSHHYLLAGGPAADTAVTRPPEPRSAAAKRPGAGRHHQSAETAVPGGRNLAPKHSLDDPQSFRERVTTRSLSTARHRLQRIKLGHGLSDHQAAFLPARGPRALPRPLGLPSRPTLHPQPGRQCQRQGRLQVTERGHQPGQRRSAVPSRPPWEPDPQRQRTSSSSGTARPLTGGWGRGSPHDAPPPPVPGARVPAADPRLGRAPRPARGPPESRTLTVGRGPLGAPQGSGVA